MNYFGINPETQEQIFETKEADAGKVKDFVRRQIMMRKFEIRNEEPKPDFSKLAESMS